MYVSDAEMVDMYVDAGGEDVLEAEIRDKEKRHGHKTDVRKAHFGQRPAPRRCLFVPVFYVQKSKGTPPVAATIRHVQKSKGAWFPFVCVMIPGHHCNASMAPRPFRPFIKLTRQRSCGLDTYEQFSCRQGMHCHIPYRRCSREMLIHVGC